MFVSFNDTATTEIYTLSLHDALPILINPARQAFLSASRSISCCMISRSITSISVGLDRKSTRLNSSHTVTSYAVFCLKKKQAKQNQPHPGPHHNQEIERQFNAGLALM